jgi:hypothetical protein
MKMSMKRHIVSFSMITLLIGSAGLPAGRAYAQESQRHIQLLSFPFGLAPGQTVRTTVAFDPVFVGGVTVAARIQLLDIEGEVIAQSDEIRIETGKTRFWEISHDQLRAQGDPGTGRLQVRTRVLVTQHLSDVSSGPPPLAPTVELYNPYITVDFVAYP